MPFPHLRIETESIDPDLVAHTSGEVVVSALGLSNDGVVDALGLGVGDSGDTEFWLRFLTSLVARGLHGVEGVSSPPLEALGEAVAALFPEAVWLADDHHGLGPPDGRK